MLIRRAVRSLTNIAYGRPELKWTCQGRAYFGLSRAQRRGGIDVEISVEITELERMLAEAKAGKPFSGRAEPPR